MVLVLMTHKSLLRRTPHLARVGSVTIVRFSDCSRLSLRAAEGILFWLLVEYLASLLFFYEGEGGWQTGFN